MKWQFFALFATLAVILVIVSTINIVTLFQGSHNMVNISASGNDIDCAGCHQRVHDNLSRSAIHADLNCEACHRFTGTGIKFAAHNGNGVQVGNQSHAAYTPRCLDCHGGNGTFIMNETGVLVKAPPAPAFNKSGYGSNYSAHKELVEKSLNYNLSVGENEACLACHTNYSLKIDYSYFWNIEYTLSSWSFDTSFSYNGTRNYDITHSKTGAKHEFVNVSDINCIKCHKNIYDALVNGTSGSPPYLTHAPIENASNWDTDNPWEHYRYHYIPNTSRATGVNNSYCFECHNVNKYANNNPNEATTYNLTDTEVINDTNSTSVHAAEALWCKTCHGSGKTKEVIDNPDYDMMGASGHSTTSPDFVDEVKNNYARTFHGDICMGCHEAAVHPSSGCGRCHSNGNADVYIESEPSGYATNT